MAIRKKPDWLKLKIQGTETGTKIEKIIQKYKLNTVCNEAFCPNKMECMENSTQTFMILGNTCTRNCKYCNVTTGRGEPVNPNESANIRFACEKMGLEYVVITSVDRDDLEDMGAFQFIEVIREIRALDPKIKVEILIPDFRNDDRILENIFSEKPDCLNHNIEACERIFKIVRPQGDFNKSMEVLRKSKEHQLITKSGFMVGLGETDDEVFELIDKLKEVGVDIITIGQYLQPSLKHMKVDRYVHPDTFKEYEDYGKKLGIEVVAGPFVRSSYKAKKVFENC